VGPSLLKTCAVNFLS